MIKSGSVVSMSYRLTNTKGEELDAADRDEPFEYLHGAHQIIPGLQTALEGLKVGDKKSVTVDPQNGYGEINEALRMSVDRSQFPSDVTIEEGMQFMAEVAPGQQVVFTVDSIKGEKVNIDGNHPLAGETLQFEVEILGVRDATEEEKAHGHAHGPGGHSH